MVHSITCLIGAVVFQLALPSVAGILYRAAGKTLGISAAATAAAFGFGAGGCPHLFAFSETPNMGHIHSTSKKEKQEF